MMKKAVLFLMAGGLAYQAHGELLVNSVPNEMVAPADKSRPVKIITDKQVGRMACLGGVVPDSKLNVLVKGKLIQVGGKQLKLFITSVQNTDREDIGSVVLGTVIYRSGEVIWVDRDGWEVCD